MPLFFVLAWKIIGGMGALEGRVGVGVLPHYLTLEKNNILKFIFLLLLKLQYSFYFQENQQYTVLLLSFFVL